MSLYIGLMSGTSMDGIDAVLADIDAAGRISSPLTPMQEKSSRLQ